MMDSRSLLYFKITLYSVLWGSIHKHEDSYPSTCRIGVAIKPPGLPSRFAQLKTVRFSVATEEPRCGLARITPITPHGLL